MQSAQTQIQLEKFLTADPLQLVDAVQKRILPRLKHHDNSLILFGTGQLGRIAQENLGRIGIRPAAFADNNRALGGTEINGVPVLSPADARARFPNSLFVVTVYTNGPVLDQLRALGIKPITFAELAWCHPDVFLPRAGLELPQKISAQSAKVREAFGLWGDDASRKEYLGQIAWRSTLDRGMLPPHSPVEETYFPPDLFNFAPDEVFVDCGAFDGDSIRAFLQRSGGKFKMAVGLEPDPKNRARFEKWRSDLPPAQARKIEVRPVAAGERREILTFDSTGTAASALGSGRIEVECVPLDQIFGDLVPTFIKMDIEGAEPFALRGAVNIIQKHQPILAICLYHAQEHLWDIPLLIHSLNPNYRLFLRRYSDECWEQVLYAIPHDRVLRY
jgi:FkbM family methyltransferase